MVEFLFFLGKYLRQEPNKKGRFRGFEKGEDGSVVREEDVFI